MFRRVLALALVVCMLAAGCGSDDTPSDDAESAQADDGTSGGSGDGGATQAIGEDEASAAPGEPIKLGNISSYSGIDIFPEPGEMARLVFKRYNEQGGLDGRPIQLITVDDQNTPEGAASGLKRLLDEDEVVGLCCGGSITDCPTNAAEYAERGVQVVPGAAACFEAPTVHPVNAGPFLPLLHLLDYLYLDEGKERICFTGYNVPLNQATWDTFVPLWQQMNGIDPDVGGVHDYVIEFGESLEGVMTKMRDDNCDSILAAFTELNTQSFFQVAEEQGVLETMDVGMLTSAYSLSLLDSVGDQMEGSYVTSEFEPYTGDEATFSEEMLDFLALNEEVGLQPSGFGQSGYVAANIMIEVLESIEGEITFESVQEAILNVEYESAIMGSTFRATGFVGGNQPNVTSKVIQVQNGQFVSVTDDWLTFPRNPPPPPDGGGEPAGPDAGDAGDDGADSDGSEAGGADDAGDPDAEG